VHRILQRRRVPVTPNNQRQCPLGGADVVINAQAVTALTSRRRIERFIHRPPGFIYTMVVTTVNDEWLKSAVVTGDIAEVKRLR
jgi:hypothetical protein